jgi:hypothetical protein
MNRFRLLCATALAAGLPAAVGPSAAPPRPDAEVAAELARAEPRILTGWGGGKAEDVVPRAAEVGFSELVVHHDDAANFARFI